MYQTLEAADTSGDDMLTRLLMALEQSENEELVAMKEALPRHEFTSKLSNAKERRKERNKMFARKARVREQENLDHLRNRLCSLYRENQSLKNVLKGALGDSSAKKISKSCEVAFRGDDILSQLMSENYASKLRSVKNSFVILNNSLPEQPIVYASAGFLELTGYQSNEVLGQNIRFLSGLNTDSSEVDYVDYCISQGNEASSCVLHYRRNGSAFWNFTQRAPMHGINGANSLIVEVHCEVPSPLHCKFGFEAGQLLQDRVGVFSATSPCSLLSYSSSSPSSSSIAAGMAPTGAVTLNVSRDAQTSLSKAALLLPTSPTAQSRLVGASVIAHAQNQNPRAAQNQIPRATKTAAMTAVGAQAQHLQYVAPSFFPYGMQASFVAAGFNGHPAAYPLYAMPTSVTRGLAPVPVAQSAMVAAAVAAAATMPVAQGSSGRWPETYRQPYAAGLHESAMDFMYQIRRNETAGVTSFTSNVDPSPANLRSRLSSENLAKNGKSLEVRGRGASMAYVGRNAVHTNDDNDDGATTSTGSGSSSELSISSSSNASPHKKSRKNEISSFQSDGRRSGGTQQGDSHSFSGDSAETLGSV